MSISRLVSLEPEQKPSLRLPAIASAETAARALRQVVGEPLRRLGDERGRAHVGFLIEFAAGGGGRIFALVDAALRHLPFVAEERRAALVAAPADEHFARDVD